MAYAIQTYMPGYGILETLSRSRFCSDSLRLSCDVARTKPRFLFDGQRRLVPKVFCDLHPQYHTPSKSNWLFFVFVALFAAFIPDSVVGDMTSIGTLFAFALVSIGVIIMRKLSPETPRPFKTPLVPLVPILAVLVCGAMIFGLGKENWLRLVVWLVIGFVIYFGYSIRHSKVQMAAR